MGNSAYKSFLKKVLIVILILLLLLLIKTGIRVFLLIFAGSLMAILWKGLAKWISGNTNIKEGLCLSMVILFNFLIFIILYIVLAPSVASQVQQLSNQLPTAIETLITNIQNTEVGSKILENFSGQSFLEKPMQQMGKVVNFFKGTLQVLIDILLIVVFGIFFATDPGLYVNGFVKLFPQSKRNRVKEILINIDQTLYRWFLGKILDMFLTAVLTGIGLWILDVPLVITFAVFTFFLSFIPNIGPVISAIPPILISLIDSPTKALYVALMYTVVQLFESYLITPNVQKHAIKMPPVLLLVFQIFLAIVLGALALFLSTPILASIIVIVQMAYIEDVLGDKTPLRS